MSTLTIMGPRTDLRLVVPDVGVAVVERSKDPWLCRVKIHGLDTLGPSHQFFLWFIIDKKRKLLLVFLEKKS